MLSLLTFLPLIGGVVILLFPRDARKLSRLFGLTIAVASVAIALWVAVGFSASGALRMEARYAWIPSIGAEYSLLLDGISLPLVLLTTILTLLALIHSSYSSETDTHDSLKEYLFLFLLMETGLIGVFLASDLLLFYVFWEAALVPLYFIIGIWGHEGRREAAMKFFLYTRAGSLALLLSILALYLRTEPHSFAMSAIQSAAQTSGAGIFALLVLLGFVLGFGVKLPIVPLHSWLPDAHVE